MLGTTSDILAWETTKLNYGPSASNLVVMDQVKISDLLIIIVFTPPNCKPQTTTDQLFGAPPQLITLFALDLNTMESWRIEDGANNNNYIHPQTLCKVFPEGNGLLVCSKEGSKLALTRITFSRDYRTIVKMVQKCCENLNPDMWSTYVLYKENLYIFAFDKLAKKPEQQQQQQKDIFRTSPFGSISQTKEEPPAPKVLKANIKVDINTMQWAEFETYGSPMPKPRSTCAATLNKNRLYMFGGAATHPQLPNSSIFISDLWVLDLDSLTWKELSPALSPSGRNLALVCSAGDKIYLYGGQPEENPHRNQPSKDLFVFDTVTNLWESPLLDKTVEETPTNDSRSTLNFHKGKLFIYQHGKVFSLALNQSGKINHQGRQTFTGKDNTIAESEDRILFTERPFPDVTFKVEGKDIPAHRAILYAGSTFFRDMLKDESNGPIIEIQDTKASVFEALLEYIYCGSANITEDIAWELFQEANKHSLPGLKTISEDFLANCISVENAVQTINMAEKYGANSLRNAALKYVVSERDRVFEEADIYELKKRFIKCNSIF